VDGMVLVQQMTKKSGTISIVKDLSQHFIDKLLTLTEDFDEVILVFDTYKAKSLKQKTREKRRQGKDHIQYQIADDTSIKHTNGTLPISQKNESRSSQISCRRSSQEKRKLPKVSHHISIRPHKKQPHLAV